jgi:predicted RNA methylase
MSAIWFLIILGILALLWPTYVMLTDKLGAPYVPMEPEVVERVLSLADLKKGEVFYDLGSGDGRLVMAAAMKGARAYGVEIDLLRVWYSRFWLWLLGLSKKAKIIRRDFFKVSLRRADVVSLYLLEETNEALKKKLKKELKKGTRIVATGFIIPGWKPVKINRKGTIYGPIRLYKA